MKKFHLKNFIAAWPIFGLVFFIILAWVYVKPLLPDDYFSLEKMKNKITNIFQKEEEWVHPDEKYDFYFSHNKLKPKTLNELEKITIEMPSLNVSSKVSNAKELQQAIKDASPDDIIELASGIYKTNLFIDKNLTIQGQGTSTVLIGGETGTAVYAENCELNLYNLAITDSFFAIKADNSSGEIGRTIIKNNIKSGIELRKSKFTIQGNIITENGSYGVFADQDSEIVIEGNFIDGNEGFEVRIEGKQEIYR
jgi:hypothetical protein